MVILPDVRQKAGWDCGRSAVEIALAGIGQPPVAVPATPLDGTDPRTLEAVLWAAGCSLSSGTMDVDDLRHHTRKGRPVICLVTEDGDGHWVVVSRVRGQVVHFQCPLRGPTKEHEKVFWMRWYDRDRSGVAFVRWGISVGP